MSFFRAVIYLLMQRRFDLYMEYWGRNGGGTVQDRKGNGTAQGRNVGKTAQGRYADRKTQGRSGKEQEARQTVNRENCMYAKQTGFASYRRSKAEKEAAIKKKPPVPAAVASMAAKSALDEMDGGNEVYEAYMAADTLAKPAANAIDAGRKHEWGGHAGSGRGAVL